MTYKEFLEILEELQLDLDSAAESKSNWSSSSVSKNSLYVILFFN